MKPGTRELIKFKKLKRRLGITKDRELVGLLESLWFFTQKQCPRGDIGRFENEDIAIELEWDGDADELIECLIACGWVDRHPTHRLVIHDWADHAPRWVHASIAKAGKGWAEGDSRGFFAKSEEASTEASIEASIERSTVASTETSVVASSNVAILAESGSVSRKVRSFQRFLAEPTISTTEPSIEASIEATTEPSIDRSTEPSVGASPLPLPLPLKKDPPTPQGGTGGGGEDFPTSRRRKRRGEPPEYSAEFLAFWSDWVPVRSTRGSMEAAWSEWAATSAHDRSAAATRAAPNYLESRRRADQKTEHVATWLAGDWRQHLEPEACHDPGQERLWADEERRRRNEVYRAWESACVLAAGRGEPPPPKPPELLKPPRYARRARSPAP